MNRTKIEWCSMTWNPVTGCYNSCKYCYARKIAHRFNGCHSTARYALYSGEEKTWHRVEDSSDFYIDANGNAKLINHGTAENPMLFEIGVSLTFYDDFFKQRKAVYPFEFEPTFHHYRLNEPYEKTEPQTIFVGSMTDLFGNWIPDSWIEKVFEACNKAPQHKYLFLTKNPERYVDLYNGKLFPYLHKENMWFGTSITNAEETERAASAIGKLPLNCNKFFSIEPLHMDIASTSAWANTGYGKWASWFIIGAETGNNKNKVIPEKAWIDNIVSDCKRDKSIYDRMFPPYRSAAPVYMKDSLVPIVGEENMKRELPWEQEQREDVSR